MSRLKSLLIALALVVAAAGPAEAKKKVKTTFKLKDRSLIAFFISEDNCSVTTTNVRFADFVVKFNGETDDPPPATFVDFEYQNICTGDHLIMSGSTNEQQVSIAGNLSSASLFSVVPVSTDPELGPPKTANMTVQISFTSDAPLVRVKDKFKSKDGGVKFVSKFEMESRTGVASGTVSGILPLDAGGAFTNLTLFPSQSAQLGRNTFGEVTVTKTVD